MEAIESTPPAPADAGADSDRFKIAVALLIALVTVIGAIVAWRAALAADAAGNADADGLAATLNAEETRVLNCVTTYEHYRAYTMYLRYNELGNAISNDLSAAGDAEAPALDRQMRESWDLATELQGSFFDSRYLDPQDGSYDTQRELEGLFADAARQSDVNPEPHLARADRMRAKSTTLIGLLTVLAASLLSFTLAESTTSRLRFVLAGGGGLLLIASVVALFVIESAA